MLTGYIFVKCIARIMLGSSIPGFLRSYSVQSIEGRQAFLVTLYIEIVNIKPSSENLKS